MRQHITASTNKIESYNDFSKFFSFGGDGVISENDPDEQEKRIKYNNLIANVVILQNVVDMTYILREFSSSGIEFSRKDVEALSPYITRHIKRVLKHIGESSLGKKVNRETFIEALDIK